jgi:hypothetical protein
MDESDYLTGEFSDAFLHAQADVDNYLAVEEVTSHKDMLSPLV